MQIDVCCALPDTVLEAATSVSIVQVLGLTELHKPTPNQLGTIVRLRVSSRTPYSCQDDAHLIFSTE